MNKIAASVFGIAALAVVTIASAHAQNPSLVTPRQPAPGTNQTLVAPYTPTAPQITQLQPLFHIGRVPVVVWAPVQPPYNSKMNRTAAAGSLWDADAY